jgi:hypothetical protein
MATIFQKVKELAGRESSHKTFPLPDNQEDGMAIYSGKHGTASVSKQKTGWHADCGNFDFSEKTAEGIRKKLQSMEYEYSGWEN